MKKVLVTQRVDHVPAYGEKRDCLDQQWAKFLLACGYLPIFAANSLGHLQFLLQEIKFSGVVLTGGNDLQVYGGTAPERDEVEFFLLQWALANQIPVLGICRGMQLLLHFFKMPLARLDGQVGVKIQLQNAPTSQYFDVLSAMSAVMVFHHWGIHVEQFQKELALQDVPNIQIASWSSTGIVMALEHLTLPIFGQMWHPERCDPFSAHDIALVQAIIEKKRGIQ